MIVDERIITFINSLDTKNSEILEDIEREALADNVPIIRREMQSFLKVLLMVKKPMRVLEVGTAVGFSALLMSEYDRKNVRSQRLKIMRREYRSQDKILSVQEKRRKSLCWKAMRWMC